MAAAKNLKRVLIALAIMLGLALLGPPIAAELLYRCALGGLDAPPPLRAKTASPVTPTAYWLASGETMPM